MANLKFMFEGDYKKELQHNDTCYAAYEEEG
jgi:hypothetical protein